MIEGIGDCSADDVLAATKASAVFAVKDFRVKRKIDH